MRLYELFVGFRYLKARKSQGFISFNTALSVFIVFIGVFVLIVVISVMNGFQSKIKDKILDVDSHVTVTTLYDDEGASRIADYRELTDKIATVDGVLSARPFVMGQGLLRSRGRITYVMVRGEGTEGDLPAEMDKFITTGKENFGKAGIYIGEEMAGTYSLNPGDSIELLVPKGRLTAAEGVEPGLGRFKILGFFKTGYYDFDTKLVIMSFPSAQRLFTVGDIASGVGIKLKDVFNMDRMSMKIRATVGFSYSVQTAEDKNGNLFYALQLEKLIMTIILLLVIISACFSIMGTLVMVVMDKRKSIGILKSMGASPNSIMVIFILEGFIIGVIGSLLGVIFGLATAMNLEAMIRWVETVVNAVMLWIHGPLYPLVRLVPTNIYYIDTIPTEIQPGFVTFIAIFAVFLSTLAAVFPAWSASRLRPVETIRYE